jgi:serine/threonine protein kinase
MEFLEGQALAARLTKGPLPLDEALKIAVEITDALDKVHRQGVVHPGLETIERDADEERCEAARFWIAAC